MRRIKRTLTMFCVVGVLFITSCSEDFINDPQPATTIGIGDAITSELTLSEAVLGLYAVMQDVEGNVLSNSSFGGYYNSVNALLSDNGYVSVNNSNRWTGVYDYILLPEGATTADIYNDLYEVVNNANFILATEGQITDEISVTGTPDDFYGQARVARAISLFKLLNFYSRPPASGLNQELGVIMPLVFVQGQSLPRLSVSEVYDQIILDLTTAIDQMELEQGQYRFGPTAANLLLSRVYLYQENYTEALNRARMVLNNSAGFQMMGITEVVPYYSSESSSETLWALEFDANQNPGNNNSWFSTWGFGGTYEQNFATREFYDLIPSTDVRKGLYTDNIPVDDYPDNLLGVDVRKFLSFDRDIPVLRMAEAKLNEIEALFFINETEARTELNSWVSTFRDASFSTSATGNALLQEIKNQRRIEFAFEGHRWFDLNRWEETIVRDANCRLNCDPIPFSSFRRVLPIPLQELDTNVTEGLMQNPGY